MTDKQPHIVPPCHEQEEILFEDQDLLLVNKPSGLLSVPGKHPANKDCLITRIQSSYPAARAVHRLDLDTSGLMIVALNGQSHKALNLQFEKREVKKAYIAEVFGLFKEQEGFVELPLICDWPNRPKQKVCHEQGKYAYTDYEVLEQDEQNNRSRLRLKPTTGRSHQLRVHMAEIGHPILGCDFYAHEEAFEMATRLLLHAERLIFSHPITGEAIDWTCPAPF